MKDAVDPATILRKSPTSMQTFSTCSAAGVLALMPEWKEISGSNTVGNIVEYNSNDMGDMFVTVDVMKLSAHAMPMGLRDQIIPVLPKLILISNDPTE